MILWEEDDKGFMIHHLLGAMGAGVVIPPKLYKNQDDFTGGEIGLTEKVANIRIHVARASYGQDQGVWVFAKAA